MLMLCIRKMIVLVIGLLMMTWFAGPAVSLARAQEDNKLIPSYLSQIEAYMEKKIEAQTQEQDQEEDVEEKLIITHVVVSGENLYSIAEEYNTDVDTIIEINDLKDPDSIMPGQVLDILTISGTIHYLQPGETVWDVSRRYGVSWEEVLELNQIENPHQLDVNTPLVIPGNNKSLSPGQERAVTAVASRSLRGEVQAPSFIWPVEGRITSHFGWRNGRFHYGLDIAAPCGTPVSAIAGGKVEFSGTKSGYGKVIILNHGQGWQSLYAHNSKLLLSAGRQVEQGDHIALAGATGNATGPHVHLEIWHYGEKLNPIDYLPH